jgi:hypothetical protein
VLLVELVQPAALRRREDGVREHAPAGRFAFTRSRASNFMSLVRKESRSSTE